MGHGRAGFDLGYRQMQKALDDHLKRQSSVDLVISVGRLGKETVIQLGDVSLWNFGYSCKVRIWF